MIKKIVNVLADTSILAAGCLGAAKLGSLSFIAIHEHVENEKVADYLSYGVSFTEGLGIGMLCRVAIEAIDDALDK